MLANSALDGYADAAPDIGGRLLLETDGELSAQDGNEITLNRCS